MNRMYVCPSVRQLYSMPWFGLQPRLVARGVSGGLQRRFSSSLRFARHSSWQHDPQLPRLQRSQAARRQVSCPSELSGSSTLQGSSESQQGGPTGPCGYWMWAGSRPNFIKCEFPFCVSIVRAKTGSPHSSEPYCPWEIVQNCVFDPFCFYDFLSRTPLPQAL